MNKSHLIFVLMWGVVLAGTSVASAALTNAGFETGDLTGWTPWPSATGAQIVQSPTPYEGSYAAQVDFSGLEILVQDVTNPAQFLTPGQTYVASFWYRYDTSSETDYPALTLHYANEQGELVGPYNTAFGKVGDTPRWSPLQLTFVAQNSPQMRITLRGGMEAGAQGNAWFDAVSITPTVANAGFETGDLTGWIPWPQATGVQAVQTPAPRQGAYAAQIDFSGLETLVQDITNPVQTLQLTAGQTYILTAWYRYDTNSASDYPALSLHYADAQWALVGDYNSASGLFGDRATWTPLELSFVAQNAANLRITLRAGMQGAGAQGSAWFDLVSIVPAPVSPPLEVYLLMGQSNMVGMDTSSYITQDFEAHPRVVMLNASNQWVPAIEPLGGVGVGLGLTFAKRMAIQRPGAYIGLVPLAQGQTPTSQWVKGSVNYQATLSKVQTASARGTVQGVLWHQGEHDSFDPLLANAYGTQLTGLVADLRQDLGNSTLPFVCGQLGAFFVQAYPYAATVNAALAALPGSVADTRCALPTGLTNMDPWHFDAASAREYGVRYFQKMLEIQEPALQGQGMLQEPDDTPQQALVNAGFEAGDLTGWIPWPSATGAQIVQSPTPYEGSHAAQVDFSGLEILVQDVTNPAQFLTPGQTYVASFWYRYDTDTANDCPGMTVHFANAQWAVVGAYNSTSGVSGDTGEWTQMQLTFEAQDTPNMRITLRAGAVETAQGTAWFDDVQITQAQPVPELEIYLLMGQSNMVGYDTAFDAQDKEAHPRVYMLDAAEQWVPAIEPVGGLGVGPGLTFGKLMADHRPQSAIGLVPLAVGSTPISQWVKGGPLYQTTLAKVQVALAQGTVRGVLWHQGENDSYDPALAAAYEGQLTALVGDLRADLELSYLPFVCGQLGEFFTAAYAPQVNAALADLPGRVFRCRCVSSQGLTNLDQWHFNAASARLLGQRYYEAMLEIEEAVTSATCWQQGYGQ